MGANVHFKFSVADVILDVSCCFQSTYVRCRDFLVGDDAVPHGSIHITTEDLEAEKKLLLSKKEAGQQLMASTPQSLEFLVLCRKTAEILPHHGAALFHGSALAFDGQGVLFTATSGTGKSTHSSIWRTVYGDRVYMVNDDKPFLKVSGNQVYVCGSPWMGKHQLGRNVCVPLKGICVLNRGLENRIDPISGRDAMPLLIQQTYRPETPAALVRSMAILDTVSRYTSLYQIFCNMEAEAAQVVCRKIFFESKENML